MTTSHERAIVMLKAALTDAGFAPIGEAFGELSIPMGKARMTIVDTLAAALDAPRAAPLDAPRAPMTEDEILQRARRAAAAANPSGKYGNALLCNSMPVNAAAHALRDLDKPLVDPLLETVRELCAKHAENLTFADTAAEWRAGSNDGTVAMAYAIAAYRAGQAA